MGKKRSRNASALKHLRGARSGASSSTDSAGGNPFELLKNKRQKHRVLNKRTRGSERNVALARSAAYKKRKQTLLQEYKASTKANVFADKRFGESGKTLLTEEDKLLERFKRARSKKSIYDLSDVGGASTEQFGFGRSLGKSSGNGSKGSGAEKGIGFEEGREESDEEEDGLGKLNAMELMEKLKGYGVGENHANKSRKEIMEEVIAKSKLFKAERQRAKERDEVERSRLDDMFNTMVQDGQFSLRPSKNDPGFKRKEASHEDEEDEYELAVKQLKFDARAEATRRTLTPEEAAKKAREELEEKQQELLKRMKADVADQDDYQGRRKRRRLGEGAEEEEEDVGDGEEKAVIEDDGDGAEEDEEDEESPEDAELTSEALERMLKASKELPFLIPAPSTHADLLKILNGYENAELSTVLSRIRKTNSIHLKAENRQKMEAFYLVVLEHLIYTVESRVWKEEDQEPSQEVAILMDVLFELSQEMPNVAARTFSMRLKKLERVLGLQLSNVSTRGGDDKFRQRRGGDYGADLAESGRPQIDRLRKAGGHKGKKGRKAVEEEHQEQAEEEAAYAHMKSFRSEYRCWPAPGDFAFFRALNVVFPVTDFRHPIVTPAQILLAKYLYSCPLRGHRDLVACAFTAQLLVEYVAEAKRFVPELYIALEAVLSRLNAMGTKEKLANGSITCPEVLRLSTASSDAATKALDGCIPAAAMKQYEAAELKLGMLNHNATLDKHAVCAGLWKATLRMVQEGARILEDAALADVILKPFATRLREIGKHAGKSKEPYHVEVQRTLSVVDEAIRVAILNRTPLKLTTSEVRPIKTYQPEFTLSYTWSKYAANGQSDAEKQKLEMKKLKRQINREQKGVARELRRDAIFLAEHRDKEKRQRQEELSAERRANFAFLQNQAATFNNAVRAGARIAGGGSGSLDMRGKRR